MMADPVLTPSETPKEPAAETPAAAPAASAVPPVTPPASETPAVTPETPAAPAAAVTPETPPAEPAAPAPTTVPETYDIAMPKAMTDAGLKLDAGLLPALTPALKKAGMTQQQLQTVAESFIEYQSKIPAMLLERDLAITMKDPDLGGRNYGRTQGHINAALAAYTTPEFRSLLAQSGLANNLEFVRAFERIGRDMAGDTAARGSPDGAPEMSRAERMYGKTTPNA